MEGTAPPTLFVPGDILAGKYRVERVLGKGAMGVVVAARHLGLGEMFAIKLLLPQARERAQALERFLSEARAAARLKGEHVAKVTDVGCLADGSPYMVMEHLAGTDLQQHVRDHGPLPVEEAVTHLLQVCDALFEAHALGIIHRDLKPANLFLTRRANGTTCVKVLDFGISKQITPEAVDLTKTGEVFGTPLYMAPEQMAGAKKADVRSDIWSMGVVLYELLTGTTPFHATTLTEVVARVLQEAAPSPSSLRAGIPPSIDAIIARCLEKQPAQRFSTIDELAMALRGWNDQLPVEASRAVSLSDMRDPPPRQSSAYLQAQPGAFPPRNPSTADGTPANTGGSWGTTGRVRYPQGSRAPLVLGVGGALTLLLGLAFVGIWSRLKEPPPNDAHGTGDPLGSAAAVIAAQPSSPTAVANDLPAPSSSNAPSGPTPTLPAASPSQPASRPTASASGSVRAVAAPRPRVPAPAKKHEPLL